MDSVRDAKDEFTPSSSLSANNEISAALSHPRDVRPRKKTSTACTVCKKRKTRCSGESPCDRCIQRGTVSECVIDSNADLRRRGASEKRTEELETDRRLLEGILEAIRTGSDDQVQNLCDMIRNDVSKMDLASHVESLVHSSIASEGSAVEGSLSASPRGDRGHEYQAAHHRPRGSIHDLLNPDTGSLPSSTRN